MKSSFEIMKIFGSMINTKGGKRTNRNAGLSRLTLILSLFFVILPACDVCETIKPVNEKSEIFLTAKALNSDQANIYGTDAAGSDLKEILKNGILLSAPTADGKFAFERTENGEKKFYTYDGEKEMKISVEPTWRSPQKAVISASGQYLVYSAENNLSSLGQPALVRAEGSVSKSISEDYIEGSGFAISPDSETLAFFAESANRMFLRLVDMNTLTETRSPLFISDELIADGSELSVAWSPDGKRLCYVYNWGGEDVLFVKSLESSNDDRTYTAKKYGAVAPGFAQDQDYLCYADRLGNIHRADVRTDTTRRYFLFEADTINAVWAKTPKWSPEGSDRVIYVKYPKNQDDYEFSGALEIVSDVFNSKHENMPRRVLCDNVKNAFWRQK